MSGIPSLGPRGEGWLVLQAFLLGAVLAACVLNPDTAGLPDPASTAVGLVLVLVGGVATLSGVFALRAADSLAALPHPGPRASLVTTGAYAYVRHPIYAGLIALAFGASIARDSGSGLVATLLLAVVLDLKRRVEESRLSTRFPSYDDYRATTKALVPFLY